MLYVGFSGGQDSCALAHYLSLEHEVALLHFDHAWEEDKGLVDKCKELADHLNLPIVILTGDTSSNEKTAREARYKAISQYTKEIYIAHTLTDTVETALYNLVRNPSLKGFSSLTQDKRYLEEYNLFINRPLLNWTRDDTKRYCELNGINYHKDAYNHNENISKRVIIRNKVVPNLVRVNKCAEKHIAQFAYELKETNEFINRYVNRVWLNIYEDNILDLSLLLMEEELIQKHIWLKYLELLGIKLRRKTIEYLLEWSLSNKVISNDLKEGIKLIKKDNLVYIQSL